MGEKTHVQKHFEKWDVSTFAFLTAGTGDSIGLTRLTEGQLRPHPLKDNIRGTRFFG